MLSLASANPRDFGCESIFFDLPGVRLHAAAAGPATGPLVLLLHGFPEAWLTFRRQIEPLASAGYRVVAPDQRGYHLSGKRGPFDLETTTADALRLVEACGAARAHVAGHDWGAAVAWNLASRYPDTLLSLAILNVPHPAVAARAIARGNVRQMARSSYIGFFQLPWLPEWLLSRGRFALLRRALQASANPGSFTGADLEAYVQAWAQPGALSAMLGWYRAILRRGPAQRRVWTEIPKIEVPTLMLWGERDQALGVELAEASARLLARGRLIRYPHATHWITHDLADEVTAQLLAHFEANASGGRGASSGL